MKNTGTYYTQKMGAEKTVLAWLLMLFAVGVYAQSQVKTAGLDKYLGVYSTQSVPLKFTISKNSDTLFARGTGQAALALVAVGPDVFKNEKMGLIMEFNPAKKQFTLKQSGQVFLYRRDPIQRPEPEFIEKDGK